MATNRKICLTINERFWDWGSQVSSVTALPRVLGYFINHYPKLGHENLSLLFITIYLRDVLGAFVVDIFAASLQ